MHISVTGGETVAEAESLTDWLRGEPGLTGVTLTGRPPGPGEMGSVLDAVTVALGAGGALSVLASSLRVWFAQPRRSDVRLKIRRIGGGTVEIDAKRVRAGDLEAILRAALEGPTLEGPAADGPAVDGRAVDRPALEGPALEGPAPSGPEQG
ncbi:effector-associated constant component EACC1 [Kitasatospora purpeofusca]|uniref:effector-associated constant component EACC1 n=1 Tax=Kitasatospora purpeofusca TaxID=67352 RepID=UPI00366413E7